MNKIFKQKLVDFIKKYHLNKMVETAKLVVSGGKISCSFLSQDKTNIGYISMENIGLEDCELGLFTTSNFLPLLDFLSEELEVKFNRNTANVIESLDITDGMNSIKFTTCDPSIIEEAPSLDGEPDYDFQILLSEEFIGNYLKSLTALPDSKFFTLKSNGKKTELVMNYNTTKSNMAKFAVEMKDDEHTETEEGEIVISTDFISKVLQLNRNTPDSYLSISKEGLVKLEFQKGDYKGVYFVMITETN